MLTLSSTIPDRPSVARYIAALFAVVTASALALALLTVLGAVPLSYGSIVLAGGFEQYGPLAFLVYGALTAVIGAGVWKGLAWARRVGILLAAIGIVLTVPAISSAVVDGRTNAMVREGLQIVVRAAVIYCLSQEPVREWFAAAHNSQQTE
jgi:hypothetical protein